MCDSITGGAAAAAADHHAALVAFLAGPVLPIVDACPVAALTVTQPTVAAVAGDHLVAALGAAHARPVALPAGGVELHLGQHLPVGVVVVARGRALAVRVWLVEALVVTLVEALVEALVRGVSAPLVSLVKPTLVKSTLIEPSLVVPSALVEWLLVEPLIGSEALIRPIALAATIPALVIVPAHPSPTFCYIKLCYRRITQPAQVHPSFYNTHPFVQLLAP